MVTSRLSANKLSKIVIYERKKNAPGPRAISYFMLWF